MTFENDIYRTSSKRSNLPGVEIKNYNVMIDGKSFFDQSIKKDKITYENTRKIATGQGDDYTTGCLLALRERCPNTEFFLVRIFPHSD